MFANCLSLSSIPNISKWDTNRIISLDMIFDNCISLFSLPDLSKWKVMKKYDLDEIFNNCPSLCSFPNIFNNRKSPPSKSKFNNINILNAMNL